MGSLKPLVSLVNLKSVAVLLGSECWQWQAAVAPDQPCIYQVLAFLTTGVYTLSASPMNVKNLSLYSQLDISASSHLLKVGFIEHRRKDALHILEEKSLSKLSIFLDSVFGLVLFTTSVQFPSTSRYYLIRPNFGTIFPILWSKLAYNNHTQRDGGIPETYAPCYLHITTSGNTML